MATARPFVREMGNRSANPREGSEVVELRSRLAREMAAHTSVEGELVNHSLETQDDLATKPQDPARILGIPLPD